MGKEQPLSLDIKFSPQKLTNKVFFCLFVLGTSMGLMDYFFNFLPNKWGWDSTVYLRRSFNITREDSLANWYSATQTLFVAIIIFLISLASKKIGESNYKVYGWKLLSFFFLFLACDDAAKIHERVGSTFSELSKVIYPSNPSYSWQPIFIPIFMVCGVFILRFLYTELKDWRLRRRIIFAFFLMFVAILMDFVEGMDLPSLASYEIRHFLKLFEEVIEMIGISVFLVTFLEVLCLKTPIIKIQKICYKKKWKK